MAHNNIIVDRGAVEAIEAVNNNDIDEEKVLEQRGTKLTA
jgi:hypothetical protein